MKTRKMITQFKYKDLTITIRNTRHGFPPYIHFASHEQTDAIKVRIEEKFEVPCGINQYLMCYDLIITDKFSPWRKVNLIKKYVRQIKGLRIARNMLK